MACPAGHLFLLSRDALRHPHRGRASSPPVPPGKLSARSGDFGKLCRRPEKSLHPRQMPPVSLTCLLLPEPLPPHLQLHTAPVSILRALCSRQASQGASRLPLSPQPSCRAPAAGPAFPCLPTALPWPMGLGGLITPRGALPAPPPVTSAPASSGASGLPPVLHPSQDPIPPSLCAPLWVQPSGCFWGWEAMSDPSLPFTWAGGTCPELCPPPPKLRPSPLHPAQPRCILCPTKPPGACRQKVRGAAPEQRLGLTGPTGNLPENRVL